jgi:hypothetical protein
MHAVTCRHMRRASAVTEPDSEPEYQLLSVENDNSSGFVCYLELRPQTLLPEVVDDTEESSTAHTPSSYDFLRRASDSLDPLSLCLFLSYLSSFNELSLLSFLGKADSCEPFEPKTLLQAINSSQWPS